DARPLRLPRTPAGTPHAGCTPSTGTGSPRHLERTFYRGGARAPRRYVAVSPSTILTATRTAAQRPPPGPSRQFQMPCPNLPIRLLSGDRRQCLPRRQPVQEPAREVRCTVPVDPQVLI